MRQWLLIPMTNPDRISFSAPEEYKKVTLSPSGAFMYGNILVHVQEINITRLIAEPLPALQKRSNGKGHLQRPMSEWFSH